MKIYILNDCQLRQSDLDHVLKSFDTLVHSLGRQITHEVEYEIIATTYRLHKPERALLPQCTPKNTLIITHRDSEFIGFSRLPPSPRSNEYAIKQEFLDNICIPCPTSVKFYIVDEDSTDRWPAYTDLLIREVCIAIHRSPKSDISFERMTDTDRVFEVVYPRNIPRDSNSGNTVYVSNSCYAINRDRGYSTLVRQGANASRGTNFTEEFIQNVTDYFILRGHTIDSMATAIRNSTKEDKLPPAFKEDCTTLNFSSNLNGSEGIHGVRFVISFSLSKEPKEVVLEKLKETLGSYNYAGVKNVIIDEDTPDDIIAFFVRSGLAIVINKPVSPPETFYTLPVKLSMECGKTPSNHIKLTVSTEYTEPFDVNTTAYDVGDLAGVFCDTLSDRLIEGFRNLILTDIEGLISKTADGTSSREAGIKVETPLLVTAWLLLIERNATFI